MKKRLLAILLLSASIQFGNVNAKEIRINYDKDGITIEQTNPCLEIVAGLSCAAILIGAYLYLTQN